MRDIMDNKNWMGHAEWAVMLVTILGLFYSMDSKFDAVNARIDSKFDSSNARMDQFMFEWKSEAKDFHGRLCAIEERNRDK